MITLFGASGYTGKLIAQALDRLGLPFRLAGRSADKLARLAHSLPSSPAWLLADASRPASLPALFRDTRVLINCVGPFSDLGEPVVAQAALNGAHYLDTTNELGYVYRVQSYDASARQSGASIVPACGFEVALADCAAAMLGSTAQPAPADEIRVVYDLRGKGTSLGTRKSALRSLATSWLAYQGGEWVRAVPCRQTDRAQLPGGPRSILSFPSSETVTVPQHLPVRRVSTWMSVSRGASLWAPWLVPLGAWLARGPFGRLLLGLISRVDPPPESGLRSQAPFTVQVSLRRGDIEQSLTLTGRGIYDITANIVTYAAAQMAQPDYRRSGILPPAQALNPRALLDQATCHWGVTLTANDGALAKDES